MAVERAVIGDTDGVGPVDAFRDAFVPHQHARRKHDPERAVRRLAKTLRLQNVLQNGLGFAARPYAVDGLRFADVDGAVGCGQELVAEGGGRCQRRLEPHGRRPEPVKALFGSDPDIAFAVFENLVRHIGRKPLAATCSFNERLCIRVCGRPFRIRNADALHTVIARRNPEIPFAIEPGGATYLRAVRRIGRAKSGQRASPAGPGERIAPAFFRNPDASVRIDRKTRVAAHIKKGLKARSTRGQARDGAGG